MHHMVTAHTRTARDTQPLAETKQPNSSFRNLQTGLIHAAPCSPNAAAADSCVGGANSVTSSMGDRKVSYSLLLTPLLANSSYADIRSYSL